MLSSSAANGDVNAEFPRTQPTGVEGDDSRMLMAARTFPRRKIEESQETVVQNATMMKLEQNTSPVLALGLGRKIKIKQEDDDLIVVVPRTYNRKPKAALGLGQGKSMKNEGYKKALDEGTMGAARFATLGRQQRKKDNAVGDKGRRVQKECAKSRLQPIKISSGFERSYR